MIFLEFSEKRVIFFAEIPGYPAWIRPFWKKIIFATRCFTVSFPSAMRILRKKILRERKKVVSLHPLSRNERGSRESERTLRFWDQEIACVRCPARRGRKTRRVKGNETSNSYNEEFDPGSGWTLAAGLTHASRGAARCSNTLAATGARVRNAYATCPGQGDKSGKLDLIPHMPTRPHGLAGKGYRSGMGMRDIR